MGGARTFVVWDSVGQSQEHRSKTWGKSVVYGYGKSSVRLVLLRP